MIAKVGLGLIGLGALGVGGVALAKPGWLGMGKDPMPEWHSLFEDKGYDTSYTDANHFGKKYGRYLVGVAKEKDDNGKTHQEWWDWAFRRMGKEITNSKFSTKGDNAKVKSGYVGDNPLSKVCEDAYKKKESEFQTAASDANITKEEVWKYCSIGGTQPKTLKEETTETYTPGKIGQDTTERTKLLSTKGDHNDWIWDLKDKEFGAAAVEAGFFQTRKNVTNRKTLKDICKEAYEKADNESVDGATIKKTEVTKYCSLEGK